MIQVLGICSSLAVTSSMKTAFVMGLSVTFVCALANLAISTVRNFIPNSVRIIAQMTVIASLVILVDQKGICLRSIKAVISLRWFDYH